MAPEIQENHEKQWKTMDMKKHEVANEKMKLKMKNMMFDGKRWWTKTKKKKNQWTNEWQIYPAKWHENTDNENDKMKK